MANLDEELYQHVIGLSGIATHFGTPVRVFQHVAQTGTALPYCLIARGSEFDHQHMTAETDLAQATMEFDIYALGFKEAIEAADFLRVNLNGVVGTDFGTRDIRRIILRSQIDTYEPYDDGSQRALYHIEQDYEIFYRRALTV